MPLDFSIAPYTTGDLIDDMVSYRLLFIDQPWMLRAVVGALSTLCDPDNWNNVGEFTPQEAASLAIKMVEEFEPMSHAGWIIPFAGSAVPDGALACDGSSYLRTAYPLLFDAIGTTWGSADSTHFNVPDLRGRAPIGSGSGTGLSARTVAQILGEETHTLTVAESASHSHSIIPHTHAESIAIPSLINGGLEAPASAAQPGVGTTGLGGNNTDANGGNGSHNNMQPSGVVNFIIYTI